MTPEEERQVLADMRAVIERAKQISGRVDKMEFLSSHTFTRMSERNATELATFIAAVLRMAAGGADLPGMLILLGILWADVDDLKSGRLDGLVAKLRTEQAFEHWTPAKGSKPS